MNELNRNKDEVIRMKIFNSIVNGRYKREDVIKYATTFFNRNKVIEILEQMEERGQILFELVKSFKYPEGIKCFKRTIGFDRNFELDIIDKTPGMNCIPPIEIEERIKKDDNYSHAISIIEVKEELTKLGYRPKENQKFKLFKDRKYSYRPDLKTSYHAHEIEMGLMITDMVISKLVRAVQISSIKEITIHVSSEYYRRRYNKLIRRINTGEPKMVSLCNKYEEMYECKKKLQHEIHRVQVVEYKHIVKKLKR